MKTNFVQSEEYTKAKATTTSASFMKPHIKACNCKTCLAKQKSEYEKGFIDGANTTGSQAEEIHACECQEKIKKIKTLKDANKEDNMISLEARLHRNDAYNECIKIIK